MDNTHLMTIIVTVSIYLIINLIFGLFKFRSLTFNEISTAHNQTGIFSLTMSLVSTIVGGGVFLGIAEMGYNGGLCFVGVGIVYLFGSISLGIFSPHIRQFAANKQSYTRKLCLG